MFANKLKKPCVCMMVLLRKIGAGIIQYYQN